MSVDNIKQALDCHIIISQSTLHPLLFHTDGETAIDALAYKYAKFAHQTISMNIHIIISATLQYCCGLMHLALF